MKVEQTDGWREKEITVEKQEEGDKVKGMCDEEKWKKDQREIYESEKNTGFVS